MGIFSDVYADLYIVAIIGAIGAGWMTYRRLSSASSESSLEFLSSYISTGISGYFRSQLMLSLAILFGASAIPFIYGLTHPKFLILSLAFLVGGLATLGLSRLAIAISTRGAVSILADSEKDTDTSRRTLILAGTTFGILMVTATMATVVFLTALFHNSFFNIQFAASHTLQYAQSTAHHAIIAEDISNMLVVIALGLGALIQTLITRITGGVFYQISDLAARSVGTLEFDLGENSFKNPGSISRYIGVHVGRVASYAANVFETFLTSIAIVIIITIAVTVKYPGIPAHQEILVLLHILGIASASALVSLITIRFLPKVKDTTILFVIAYLIFAVLTGGGTYFLLFKNQLMLPGAMSSVLFGLILGIIGIGISYGFSRRQSRSVQHGIQSGEAGVLQVIIGSLSKGMFASVILTVVVVFVVLLSYDRIGGSEVLRRGVYDIGLVAVSAVFYRGIL
jgi:Na+/H+-translocating membrane pyrophosphatase